MSVRHDERHNDPPDDLCAGLHHNELHDEFHKGAPVMKKFLLLIATVVGALAIQKKLKNQQAEQDLWAEATDKV